MLSRALSLATVTLLIGCLAATPVRAQNLEAGKSPSQIFAGTCTACHKGARGLLKTVPPGSLPGFLRQHYTTSSEMASLLSAFLISNGATDTRYVGTKPTQQPKDAQPAVPEQLDRFGRPIRPPSREAARPEAPPQQVARPDADGLVPQAEPGRPGRNAKRLARPSEAPPDAAKPAEEGQPPAQAAIEPGPDGRKAGAKQKLSKRGKPGGEELPKADAKPDAAKPDTAKPDTAKEESAKGEPAKDDAAKGQAKEDTGKPSGEGKSESAKIDAPNKIDAPKETSGETPALRADPVPPVTPAPPAAASTTASSGPQDPAASASAPAQSASPAAQPAPSAVTASVPPPPPVAPAGPPVPPISQ